MARGHQPDESGGPASVGTPTNVCRLLCTALVAAPLLYFHFVTDGSAFEFLVWIVLGVAAGAVLIANSLFCMVRYRKIESPLIGLLFIIVGVIGGLTAVHFLPHFRM